MRLVSMFKPIEVPVRRASKNGSMIDKNPPGTVIVSVAWMAVSNSSYCIIKYTYNRLHHVNIVINHGTIDTRGYRYVRFIEKRKMLRLGCETPHVM